MRVIKPSKVIFADDQIEKEFFSLDESDNIRKQIKRAMEEMLFAGFLFQKD